MAGERGDRPQAATVRQGKIQQYDIEAIAIEFCCGFTKARDADPAKAFERRILQIRLK
ncbi:MAG: hypothetical protein AAFX40_15130 [Cyanobacteria bacterium J06639_1]